MIWKHPIETTIKKNLVVWSSRYGEREICLQKEHLEGSWILATRIHLVVPYIYIYVDSMYIYIYYIYMCCIYTFDGFWNLSFFKKKHAKQQLLSRSAFFQPKSLEVWSQWPKRKGAVPGRIGICRWRKSGTLCTHFWVEEGNVDGVDGYTFRGQVGSNSTGFPGSAWCFFWRGHQVATGFNDK